MWIKGTCTESHGHQLIPDTWARAGVSPADPGVLRGPSHKSLHPLTLSLLSVQQDRGCGEGQTLPGHRCGCVTGPELPRLPQHPAEPGSSAGAPCTLFAGINERATRSDDLRKRLRLPALERASRSSRRASRPQVQGCRRCRSSSSGPARGEAGAGRGRAGGGEGSARARSGLVGGRGQLSGLRNPRRPPRRRPQPRTWQRPADAACPRVAIFFLSTFPASPPEARGRTLGSPRPRLPAAAPTKPVSPRRPGGRAVQAWGAGARRWQRTRPARAPRSLTAGPAHLTHAKAGPHLGRPQPPVASGWGPIPSDNDPAPPSQ